jgi:selenocysteine-specific translation elongation factor
MLVATKIDLEEARQVRTSEGQLLADTEGMHYVEISNKTGEGIQELVREISKLIFDKEQGGALESTRKD